MEILKLVFNHNYAQNNHLGQERGLSPAKQHMYTSRHLLGSKKPE